MNWLDRLFGRKPPPVDPPPRETLTPKPGPMKITPSSHAIRARMRDHDGKSFAEMFPVAQPPPGVVPEGVVIAMDDNIQPLYGYAGQGWYGEGVVWLGFPYLAELAQRPEFRMGSETRAREATRKGFELISAAADDEGAEDRLKELDQACKDFHVIEHLRIASEHDGFFGGGQIYIDTGAGDRPMELASPLLYTKEKIPKGGLKGFKNIEPMWSYPGMYNSTDPLHDEYFKPSLWYVNGKTVHHTRLLTMIGSPVPDILKPAYSFRGISRSQLGKPYVDNWLRTRQSVSDILHSFSIVAISSNLQASLMGAGWDTIYSRVDEFNALRDNRGAFVLDKETEDIKIVATPLGTLDALQGQSQEAMCSVWATPSVKLLGIQPAGLNASSDGEIRVYYDDIHSYQERVFNFPLQVMLKCIQLHLWGEIDPDISFKWVPLWQLDEAAEAVVRKTDADTAAVYIESGVLAPEDERTRLASDKDGPWAGIDPDDLPEPPEQEAFAGAEGDPAKGLGETSKQMRAADAAFVESEHPRDNEGKFAGFNAQKGTLNSAQLISSQEYRDDDTVAKKIREKDFDVFISPEFEIDGELFRTITDGHHSLEAALATGNHPNFIEQSSSDNDKIAFLENGEIEDFLEASHMGDDYHNVITKSSAF